MRHFRTFGQSIMKRQLRVEARKLIENLQRTNQHSAMQMNTAFNIAVVNSVWYMFAGHTFEYDDQKLQEILTIFGDAAR